MDSNSLISICCSSFSHCNPNYFETQFTCVVTVRITTAFNWLQSPSPSQSISACLPKFRPLSLISFAFPRPIDVTLILVSSNSRRLFAERCRKWIKQQNCALSGTMSERSESELFLAEEIAPYNLQMKST